MITATPADRSNSPPIISRHDADRDDADRRALVEHRRRTTAGSRNGGATAKKKMKMTIAADERADLRAAEQARDQRPLGRAARVRARRRLRRDGVLMRMLPDRLGRGDAGGPAPPGATSACCSWCTGRIWSMLVLSTNDGPVRTGLPPPMSLPLRQVQRTASRPPCSPARRAAGRSENSILPSWIACRRVLVEVEGDQLRLAAASLCIACSAVERDRRAERDDVGDRRVLRQLRLDGRLAPTAGRCR